MSENDACRWCGGHDQGMTPNGRIRGWTCAACRVRIGEIVLQGDRENVLRLFKVGALEPDRGEAPPDDEVDSQACADRASAFLEMGMMEDALYNAARSVQTDGATPAHELALGVLLDPRVLRYEESALLRELVLRREGER